MSDVSSEPSSLPPRASVLPGQVVVVTGGGRGVGLAVAKRCAREGANVLVVDNGCDVSGNGFDDSVARDAAAAISGSTRVIGLASDITTESAASEIAGFAKSEFGRIDALIHCAGIQVARPFVRLERSDVSRVLGVHVEASIWLGQAFAQQFIAQRTGGAILFSAGPEAFFGQGISAALASVASGALVSLTRSLAAELKRSSIRVNAFVPTALTRMTEHLPTFEGIAENSLRPEDVASLAAFLVSPMAASVTGEIFGAAGVRVYTYRTREAPGVFGAGRSLHPAEIAERLRELSRA